MLQIQPYIIVPNLIEQPTWGGEYIVNLKHLGMKQLNGKVIGQSYELFRNSHLSLKRHTRKSPSIELAGASTPDDPERIYTNDKPFAISTLIAQDSVSVLGKEAIAKHGGSIELMIKLNQAKGNSYQVHAKKKTADNNWLPKPESWYFFEPGLVTLGLNPKKSWREYQLICQLIEKEARLISKNILQGNVEVEWGRRQLATLIKKHNPVDYVNVIQVAKNSAIDLSAGGIHHSWEENHQTYPHGNIVYEVQKNVYDPDCTIRAFDKGKIKSDGSVRELDINDYFTYVDTRPEANRPTQYYQKGTILKKTATYTVRQIFKTSYYSLKEISFNQSISNQHTQTNQAYQHLFVRQGNVLLNWHGESWYLTPGFSAFIPASVGKYQLKPAKRGTVKVLITSI